MKPLVEAYFPWDASQQEELQKKSFHYDRAWILSRGSQNTGFLQLQETSFSIEIEKFYLLPEWQGLGIGTTLFEGIINHANKEGKKLTLSVLKNNRAKSLYQRLGFTVQDENHYKFMMEWNNMPSP